MAQTSLSLEQEGNPLDSWKEIAAYLNRNVRTVQRWEKREGLPVHRHVHEKASSVSAYKQEIDAWQKQRSRVSREITENPRDLELVIERFAVSRLNDEWDSLSGGRLERDKSRHLLFVVLSRLPSISRDS